MNLEKEKKTRLFKNLCHILRLAQLHKTEVDVKLLLQQNKIGCSNTSNEYIVTHIVSFFLIHFKQIPRIYTNQRLLYSLPSNQWVCISYIQHNMHFEIR